MKTRGFLFPSPHKPLPIPGYKPLLVSLALLCAPACVLSQGVVAFRNDNLSSPPDRLVHCGFFFEPLVGTTFAAQLLYGTDPESLQPHPTLAYFRAPTTSSPGTWIGGNRTLTGIAAPPTPGPSQGATIWLQVAVWDSGPSRTLTYDQVRAAGGFYGLSQPFQYTQRLSSPPDPVSDTAMVNFRGFGPLTCVPEPAAALLLLPAITFVWLLKRKTKH